MSGWLLGFIGGGISGLSTTLGSVPVLFKNPRIANILKKINMDFVTGIMLSAAAFALIYPAYTSVATNSKQITDFIWVTLALFGGVLFITTCGKALERLMKNSKNLEQNKKAMLFVIAMMVHNFPEGLASGASMTIPDKSQSVSLLTAIAVQNVPEGLTTALSFAALGLNPMWAFFGSMLTGVVELVGGIIGGHLSSQIDGILPLLMAFAGGAMMSVTIVEIIARLKAESFRFLIGPSFLSGIVLMIFFNNLYMIF